jgi:hypothetical protein
MEDDLVQADLPPTMMPLTTAWYQMALDFHRPQILQTNQVPLVKTYPLMQLQESPRVYPNSHMHLFQASLGRGATFSSFSSFHRPEWANETAMVLAASFLALSTLLLPLD